MIVIIIVFKMVYAVIFADENRMNIDIRIYIQSQNKLPTHNQGCYHRKNLDFLEKFCELLKKNFIIRCTMKNLPLVSNRRCIIVAAYLFFSYNKISKQAGDVLI